MIPIHIPLYIVVTVWWLSIILIVIKIQLPNIPMSHFWVSFGIIFQMQLDCSSFDIPLVLEFFTVHSYWCTPLDHLKTIGSRFIKLEFPWSPVVHRITTLVALLFANLLGISLSMVWGAVILLPFQYYYLQRDTKYGPIYTMPWCRGVY